MCAGNIYMKCTWEIDQGLELFQAVWKLFKDNSTSNNKKN